MADWVREEVKKRLEYYVNHERSSHEPKPDPAAERGPDPARPS